ncbi:hypothetical protein MTR_1g026690 [Medicago truncatula]|uniref:Reverse transcriptase zinc-binding domain-containing protein n=1 Tax=Medicago truncatula TaxID=3880 RepID=A0A072VEQ1_MEDTR|nr:hypothetical protein MTR_1g026690 [Medicago truncatula]
MENLWTLKAILRGFEMASGLKVNFSKSSFIGVNVPNAFMDMACDFLNCSRGNIPFMYLGLPVGANHGRAITWDHLVGHLNKRLNSWGNRYISLGGRIVLLNSVLNAIPIYYLSFMKMSVKVWRKIVRIQRDFLWGGVEGGRKIAWVKWSKVCLPKARGGLGVRDVRKVNLSLLAKWRWRLIHGENLLWKEWKDLMGLDRSGNSNWFTSEVVRTVGNGNKTSFWNHVWVGEETFRSKYPRLFDISNQKEVTIGDMWVQQGVWEWSWRRIFFVWEENLFANLLRDVEGCRLSDEEDRWVWKLEEKGVFSVKSMFKKLENVLGVEDEPRGWERGVFKDIWESPAPSKVVAFSWKLLYDWIPCRRNLAVRIQCPPSGRSFDVCSL